MVVHRQSVCPIRCFLLIGDIQYFLIDSELLVVSGFVVVPYEFVAVLRFDIVILFVMFFFFDVVFCTSGLPFKDGYMSGGFTVYLPPGVGSDWKTDLTTLMGSA